MRSGAYTNTFVKDWTARSFTNKSTTSSRKRQASVLLLQLKTPTSARRELTVFWATEQYFTHAGPEAYLCKAKLELFQLVQLMQSKGYAEIKFPMAGTQAVDLNTKLQMHLRSAVDLSKQGAEKHGSLLCGRFYTRLVQAVNPPVLPLNLSRESTDWLDPRSEVVEQVCKLRTFCLSLMTSTNTCCLLSGGRASNGIMLNIVQSRNRICATLNGGLIGQNRVLMS